VKQRTLLHNTTGLHHASLRGGGDSLANNTSEHAVACTESPLYGITQFSKGGGGGGDMELPLHMLPLCCHSLITGYFHHIVVLSGLGKLPKPKLGESARFGTKMRGRHLSASTHHIAYRTQEHQQLQGQQQSYPLHRHTAAAAAAAAASLACCCTYCCCCCAADGWLWSVG
jgi:hypothetical protein